MTDQTRFDVPTSDGLTLAGFRYGEHDPALPTVLAIHGYPDNHHVWDGVAAALAGRANVYTYDVRGAGDSEAPAGKAGYRFDRLISDVSKVIDAVREQSGDRSKVHLLGHDWGSIQGWHAVVDPAVADKTASYTSISGPNLNHAGEYLKGARRFADVPARLRQAAGSTYIPFFLAPGLADALYRRGWGQKLIETLEKRGTGGRTAEGYERSDRDFTNGLNLYRANMPGPFLKPAAADTTVPVQVVTPEGDLFVTRPVQLAGLTHSPKSRDVSVPGGHWVVAQNPSPVADVTFEWIEANR
ncbi:Alpha/beta hydrolase fold protein OS=Tsukamurella paurometabola (strain ATCC 8368 / DSM / CCUG 35730 / CIP 100753 / JCM 10117 / KCTC 9821 / NBRC 16120 /NCIMB 702349 / NCTC 13040) OX=521096 GN=Tpau_0476 PE=3 SV=1 [Tsukamurella paurometabola]|uniref:Alpha/beta hydrolase fold protein n=1 Tax=Tsukamurella paurometabola (strain ATCC 8368 / DSM 20162 / CCUG 35730 / CIP 100753 / JCM 10117 / KCTC 9821 / NBRC 16120 / NCIMB 702349 / NCTC 13040) TaxID=521096 RepID=D5US50_TSUPD|nr:alpha/beta fold hydrolase [Tsukamurella paurometabola]ADG77117.1 alpha/beta hydrolase fold protein [Tsukamurella paurometabola DSM 20162]SUP42843.1 Haloacetate dehalogenase H-1 [Tsukamurella paurometabola]